MTTIDPETLVGDVVTAHPALARELEEHGLDYCCHGPRRLADACRVVGLDPVTIATDLEAAADTSRAEPWSDLDPAAMVDHIETVHHRYLWDEFPRLAELIEKVLGAHVERHPELGRVAACFATLRADLEPHLIKEERVLFPMMRDLADATRRPTFHCGRITNPISMMLIERDRAGLLRQLRSATDNYRVPKDGCTSYQALYEGFAQLEADTHLHIHKENNLLFPRRRAPRATPFGRHARPHAAMTNPATRALAPRASLLPDLDCRAQIARLVRDFYRHVAMDDLLGPVFGDAHVDWSTHISTLVDFCAKQLLGEPGYDGNPLRAHAPIHARTPFTDKHYKRWLDLFTSTVDECFAGPCAELAKPRAHRMARALQRLLDGSDASGSAPIRFSLTTRTPPTTGSALGRDDHELAPVLRRRGSPEKGAA